MKTLFVVAVAGLFAVFSTTGCVVHEHPAPGAPPPPPAALGAHPAYLHALSDLATPGRTSNARGATRR